MSKAEKIARQDMAKEIIVLYPNPNTWDQFNVTVSHVFTKESRKLNKELDIN